ncbi:PhoPQ-activated protein PqaA family protein [Phenylobacterium sp.]|uniref:PhoPQ-activated pathogenicity-related family protein n=1 Tax=Phenylobacterium ferrooxidans TaxID=2982689 RepID=A0ABW6CU89_9CAUL|nr:PhoPQ-activated protein PqaA family protein [Phenylobacterium sp.]MDP3634987.1 PhoPQ-activated protein PqaA family protein [Phenylobacterium sp.]MDP3868504.1 PhoPQ-activated protein PqaA family protein [Phenylobacterium sp.]
MNLLKLLGGVIAAAALAAAPAAVAKGPNALDAYVAKPEPSFGWKVVGPISGPGYHGAVLEMTSQSWTTETMLPGQDLWKHWVTVIVPDKVTSDKGFLYITGGDKGDAAPTKAVDRFAKLAVETSSVVVELDDVPNQPLRFSDEPKDHVEDEIIAYLQARYAKTRDPNQLLRLPMVKSGTQAMTAAQQYLASDAGGRMKLNGFVVAGGSKRGWTTWLVGAVDRRVIGIVPIVINVLNVDATAIHHWRAMGYFSPALGDYVHYGLIPGMIGKPGLRGVNLIEDPINYQDRPQMRIPKFVINAVGDEYFPPDNTRFGYYKVAEPKRLRMIPNSKHSTAGTDIMESITAFHDAVIRNRPIPSYRWGVRKDGAIVVRSAVKPMEVFLWQGTNPKARDFRVDSIGKAFTATRLQPQKDGSYVGLPAQLKSGFTAYFVELVYPSGTKYPFKFTTEVQVSPDVLPYRWEDAKPITAPTS